MQNETRVLLLERVNVGGRDVKNKRVWKNNDATVSESL